MFYLIYLEPLPHCAAKSTNEEEMKAHGGTIFNWQHVVLAEDAPLNMSREQLRQLYLATARPEVIPPEGEGETDAECWAVLKKYEPEDLLKPRKKRERKTHHGDGSPIVRKSVGVDQPKRARVSGLGKTTLEIAQEAIAENPGKTLDELVAVCVAKGANANTSKARLKKLMEVSDGKS